ncbi:hypothetical protein J2046_006792 [Rhizobium petrolearium]|uniref:hypothetical protein n=1 Tax=Neorhizobium petrolearium TaxID=515361 RepID=UPI001AE21AEB|nr:hypothetical protein [Neorhizobium petrolearium]MBP1848496.1 hypothetical protein [Neorhizobium petrolearium]
MSIEKATKKNGKSTRSVTLPGGKEKFIDTDPVAIARVLRSKSKLGLREEKLAAAERKLNG